jgi:hypothetical protein
MTDKPYPIVAADDFARRIFPKIQNGTREGLIFPQELAYGVPAKVH